MQNRHKKKPAIHGLYYALIVLDLIIEILKWIRLGCRFEEHRRYEDHHQTRDKAANMCPMCDVTANTPPADALQQVHDEPVPQENNGW